MRRETRPPRPAARAASASNTARAANRRGAAISKAVLSRASLVDQRAGALIREQLKQYRMLHLAVDDDDALHALLQRVDAGLDLRDHAAGNGAVGDQLARVLDR